MALPPSKPLSLNENCQQLISLASTQNHQAASKCVDNIKNQLIFARNELILNQQPEDKISKITTWIDNLLMSYSTFSPSATNWGKIQSVAQEILANCSKIEPPISSSRGSKNKRTEEKESTPKASSSLGGTKSHRAISQSNPSIDFYLKIDPNLKIGFIRQLENLGNVNLLSELLDFEQDLSIKNQIETAIISCFSKLDETLKFELIGQLTKRNNKTVLEKIQKIESENENPDLRKAIDNALRSLSDSNELSSPQALIAEHLVLGVEEEVMIFNNLIKFSKENDLIQFKKELNKYTSEYVANLFIKYLEEENSNPLDHAYFLFGIKKPDNTWVNSASISNDMFKRLIEENNWSKLDMITDLGYQQYLKKKDVDKLIDQLTKKISSLSLSQQDLRIVKTQLDSLLLQQETNQDEEDE